MTQIESDRQRTAPNAGRVPPSVIEAEESLIGAMLQLPEAVFEAAAIVEAATVEVSE